MLTLTGAIGFRLFERLSFAGIRCVTLLHGIGGRLVSRFEERRHTNAQAKGINFMVELRPRAIG